MRKNWGPELSPCMGMTWFSRSQSMPEWQGYQKLYWAGQKESGEFLFRESALPTGSQPLAPIQIFISFPLWRKIQGQRDFESDTTRPDLHLKTLLKQQVYCWLQQGSAAGCTVWGFQRSMLSCCIFWGLLLRPCGQRARHTVW